VQRIRTDSLTQWLRLASKTCTNCSSIRELVHCQARFSCQELRRERDRPLKSLVPTRARVMPGFQALRTSHMTNKLIRVWEVRMHSFAIRLVQEWLRVTLAVAALSNFQWELVSREAPIMTRKSSRRWRQVSNSTLSGSVGSNNPKIFQKCLSPKERFLVTASQLPHLSRTSTFLSC